MRTEWGGGGGGEEGRGGRGVAERRVAGRAGRGGAARGGAWRGRGPNDIVAVRVRAQISSPLSLDIVSFCLCLLVVDYLIPLCV